MADTYTTNLNLTKPEPGAAEDTWGISLNADLDALDAIFSTSGTQINLNPNQVNFADNKKAIFGTGSDLEIYHDGSNSYIKDTGTGNLRISGTQVDILNPDSNEFKARFKTDGAVELYHDNSKKFETTSSGIDVTGTVTSDGLTVDGSGIINQSANTDINGLNGLRINDSTGTGYGAIGVVTGNDLRITSGDAGGTNDKAISFRTANAGTERQRLRIGGTGDISFYEDTGTTQALFWDASQARLGIGETSLTHTLHVKGSANEMALFKRSVAGNSEVKIDTTTSGDAKLTFASNGTSAYTMGRDNSDSSFRIASGGTIGVNDRLVINSSGNATFAGTVTSDGLTVDAALATINAPSNNADLILTEGGTNTDARIRNSNGILQIGADINNEFGASEMQFSVDGKEFLSIDRFGDISFYDDTGSTQGFFWDASAESLGIGTTSPQELLHLEATEPLIRFDDTNSGLHYILGQDGDGFKFTTNNSTYGKYTFDSSVGIGTVSPNTKLHVKTDTDGDGITIQRNSTTAGTYGQLGFSASTNDAGIPNVWIRGYRGSAYTDNYMTFGTGGNTGSEAGRFDASGNLLIGKTTTATANVGIELRNDGLLAVTRDTATVAIMNRNTNGTIIDFRKSDTSVGSISTAGGTTSYNTSSDARLKDVTGEARGLEVITKLNPVAYNWKADGKADEGLIAQEVKELVPNAVTGSEDEHYQMDYSKLVTHLVKAVQELEQQTIELKKEIANLKGE